MQESGVTQKIKNTFLPSKKKCEVTKVMTADLINVSALFIILFTGFIISITVLFIELLIRYLSCK